MQGLLTNDGKVQKVLLNAIDPAQERKVSIIDNFMQQGKLDDLAPGSSASSSATRPRPSSAWASATS
jgi:ABC-type lipoprotein release transport system permease subunit